MFNFKLFSLICLCLSLTACGSHLPPPVPGGLPPAASQAIVVLRAVEAVAVSLNTVQVCDPAPCHALLSAGNTRIVQDAVDASIVTITAVPGGWRATALTALEQVSLKLDAAGLTKLDPYLAAARVVIDLVP